MRTRALPLAIAAATAASALAFAPAPASVTAAGEGSPAAPCDDTVGRELLGIDGLAIEDMSAPGVLAPELAATNDVTGDVVTPHRTAAMFFTLDIAPYTAADIEVSVAWPEAPSDFDLYGYTYEQGFRYPLGTSNESNIDGGDTRSEQFTATVADCQLVDIDIRSWAGNPTQALDVQITVTPKGDPAPGVAARVEDNRRALYLAGPRPGNATTPADTAGAEYPLVATFREGERSNEGMPNFTTRPVAGSTIEKNPVQPWWTGGAEDYPTLQGVPSALVWLSSPTQEHDPGTILVQLFVNGQEHTVEIDGAELSAYPKAFLVEFPEVDTLAGSMSLQVSALPIASPNAASEHLGDANHTVWFDSVQYQSVLYVPVTGSGF